MIRLATVSDVPAVVALVNAAFRGDSSRMGWTTEADLLGGQRVDAEAVTQMVVTAGHAVLVREQDDGLIACVHLAQTGDGCYLGMMTVLPTAQGAGIGGQMLEAAERWAVEQWGSRSMHMTVITLRAELFTWYGRRGYRRTGEHKPFPYGDERLGLPRRDDLVFEVLAKSLLS
jgi:GNAT superfamily N-acetyltransferase